MSGNLSLLRGFYKLNNSFLKTHFSQEKLRHGSRLVENSRRNNHFQTTEQTAQQTLRSYQISQNRILAPTSELETIEFQSLCNAVWRQYLPSSDHVMWTLKFYSFQLWWFFSKWGIKFYLLHMIIVLALNHPSSVELDRWIKEFEEEFEDSIWIKYLFYKAYPYQSIFFSYRSHNNFS